MGRIVDVKVKVTPRFQKALRKLGPVIYEDGLTAVTRAAIAAEGIAKQLAPVLTSRLKNSMTHNIIKDTRPLAQAEVGSNVEYAPFVEEGTATQIDQPFLRPAILAVRAPYIRAIIKAIKNAGGKV